MRRVRATIRFGEKSDISAICDLERRVWSSHSVAPLSEATVQAWITTHQEGFLVGEYRGQVRGYAYFEHLSFDPEALDSNWPPAHAPTTTSQHHPNSSAMLGISAAADLAGLGAQFISKTLELGKERGKTHLATLIRMQGLGRFLEELRTAHAETNAYTDAELVLWYAIHCVRTVGGSIAPNLAQRSPPDFFPHHIRKDPVLTYPMHVAHMTLRGIIPSSFSDKESANLLALVTFPTF